jgi:rubrerythrin
MELKGSKTEKNLQMAFAGESQARNTDTFYASKAKKEGYVQISNLFLETAGNEKEHAELWYKALCGGEIPGTIQNLLDAAAGEHEEWTSMYADMAKTAAEEGFVAISKQMEGVAAIEKRHEERYLALKKNIESGAVFARDDKTAWICSNCGHVHVGANAPKECPVCRHEQAYFQLHVDAF